MANKIPTEIIIKILNNVQSTQDLYSSLLVDRIWCKITIPILWELPFGQPCCLDENLRKKALCIRTYISCMDTQTRTLLIQNGFDLSSSPPQATFDYPSFAHKFIINNLVYFVSTYPHQIICPDNNNNDNETIILTKSRILFREICKLIINRCSFLDYFKLLGVPEYFSQNFRNYSDLINPILNLPSAPKVFKKLESLTSITRDKQIRSLYESLALICDNILNMDLTTFSSSQAQLFAKLISVQKRLENLSIDFNYIDSNSLFWAVISQKETLKSLRMCFVSSRQFEGKSSPREFISLQELYIENCSGFFYSFPLSLASSFPQLSSFHFRQSHAPPQEFIIKILETANTNLKNICIDLYYIIRSDIFSAILNYCTKITKLTLNNLSPEQVIAIFNNNFNELRRFSFECRGEGFDANKLLCRMAENIPESLDTIGIRMMTFSASADSLRSFFEGWCYKCGGGSKKFIIRSTELPFTLSDEHFKVIEEYGVQFDIEE